MKYRFQHVAEYALLRGFASLVAVLPYRVALGFGCTLAAFAHYVVRYRVSTARTRLRSVFGDRFSDREIRGIAWRAWRNFVFSSVEMLRRRRMTLESIGAITDWDEAHVRMKAHADSGAGGIVATAHMGSWEMAAVACEKLGMRMVYLAARQKNPLIDKFWHDLRRADGQNETVLRTTSGMRTLHGLIRDGRHFTVLPDVRSKHAGVSVPFLGGTANIGTGMARVAHKTNVSIFPCICIRHGWARHEFSLHDPVQPDPAAERGRDVERMTREVLAIIDRAIHDHPDQWFWFNKRWILDPL